MGDNVTAHAGVAEAVGIVETVTVSMRGYLSAQHLWAAEHFTRLATEVEAAHSGGHRFSPRHRSYVLGAVGESVAFLEAFVNELFQDAKDSTDGVPGAATRVHGLPDDAVRLMAAHWNSTRDGVNTQTVAKYDAARTLCGHPRGDAGRLPAQDVPRVISLRNWSVHYRPLTFSHDEPDLRLEDARARIAENGLMLGAGNPWFPERALGAGCARWAVQTMRVYVDEFVEVVGCPADYQDLTHYDEQP